MQQMSKCEHECNHKQISTLAEQKSKITLRIDNPSKKSKERIKSEESF